MRKPRDFADDRQLEMKVRQIFGLIKDANYTGEVLDVIYRFLLEYTDIVATTDTITYPEMMLALDGMHHDLIAELKTRMWRHVKNDSEEGVNKGGE